MVDDVDEMKRDEPGLARELAIGAHAADVVGIREGHHDDACLVTASDGGGHGFARDTAAIPALAVEHEKGAVIPRQLGRRVRHNVTGPEVLYVGRYHADSVAVVAIQVGAHEV